MTPLEKINELQRALKGGEQHLLEWIPDSIALVIKRKYWQHSADRKGQPFASFEAFAAHPVWQGLGCTIDDMLAYCRKRPEIQQLIREEVAQIGSHGANQHSGGDIVTSSSVDRGNGSTYTLRRLKRDAPELAAKVARGEMSANAAAVAAGFRAKQVQIGRDPKAAAQQIITIRGLAYARELAAAIAGWAE